MRSGASSAASERATDSSAAFAAAYCGHGLGRAAEIEPISDDAAGVAGRQRGAGPRVRPRPAWTTFQRYVDSQSADVALIGPRPADRGAGVRDDAVEPSEGREAASTSLSAAPSTVTSTTTPSTAAAGLPAAPPPCVSTPPAIAPAGHDVDALAHEPANDGPPDTARPPGDEDGLPGKLEVHRSAQLSDDVGRDAEPVDHGHGGSTWVGPR